MQKVVARATHTFRIEALCNGEPVSGLFTAKRLSIADQRRKTVRATELCGGMHCVIDGDGISGRGVDYITWRNALAQAHMEVALSKPEGMAPEWFNFETMCDDPDDDECAFAKVHAEVEKFEDSFRRVREAANEGAGGTAPVVRPASSDGSGEGNGAGADAGRRASLVGGEGLPAPLQP